MNVWLLEKSVQNGSFLIGLGGFEDLMISDWFTHFLN